MDRATPHGTGRGGVELPDLPNALGHGAQQAFRINADGKGYVQELAIPWKLLCKDGKMPAPGSELRVTVEPNFTAGAFGRLTIKDLFRVGAVPNRIFTFYSYDIWGAGILEKTGKVVPAPLRLADGRELPVRLVGGVPVVDWSRLAKVRELPGFKTLAFEMPFDGHVSLNLRNKDGVVVRQLLTDHPYVKGSHKVKWDGLPTPHYRTPGEPLPAGEYTWEAIAHPGLTLTLRGWAAAAGIPWAAGPGTDWGGDHGVPSACATDGEKVYLGWNGAEGGKSVLACDADGKLLWGIGKGIGSSAEHLAVDGGIVYGLGWDGVSGRQLFRLRAKDGVFDNWISRGIAALAVPDLWAERTDKGQMPDRADGMDVKHGVLYLTFSAADFRPDDISDLAALTRKVLTDATVGPRLLKQVNPRFHERLQNWLAGQMREEDAFCLHSVQGPWWKFELPEGLTRLLDRTDLAAGNRWPGAYEPSAGQPPLPGTAVRRASASAQDGTAGRVRCKLGPLAQAPGGSQPGRGAGRERSPGVCYRRPPDRAGHQPADGRKQAVDYRAARRRQPDGGCGGPPLRRLRRPDQQVKIFTAEGKPAGQIGRRGGRPLLGPWQADGFYAISSLLVDKQGRLWVTEGDRHPKRISIWDMSTGKPVKELFGPTHYGASGGAICPTDPNLMVGEGCEWRFDPKTQTFACTGVFDRSLHGFAKFCTPANGRLYLAVTRESQPYRSATRIFQRIGEGTWRVRAEVRPDFIAKTTTFWSDVNGDGREDPGETITVPMVLVTYGSNAWSLNLNPQDFTLYGVTDGTRKVYQVRLAGYTACGAPRWDVAGMKELPFAGGKDVYSVLPSPDNRLLLTCGEHTYYRCYEIASGKLLWSYPNPFFQVHGSHHAPAPEPGLTRGAYGFVGTFTLPNTGTVWAINANLGEWYLLTEKGYFLARIFEGDPMQWQWPAKAEVGADMTRCPPGSGGEDFGGSLTQGIDGKVYVQAGKNAVWNLELGNLDRIRIIGTGTIILKPEEQSLARAEFEKQCQRAVGVQTCEVRRLTPTFTGNLGSDFQGINPLEYKKQDDAAVKTLLAWDAKNLYLGFEVADNSPWVNGAKEPPQMYVSGDTVDFQFGSDPKADPKRSEAVAGDFRLSIGNFLGRPTAVLYRKVSAEKRPKTFTSGVIAQYVMDYVEVVRDAKIAVKIRPDGKGYVVEAAVPLTALAFTPQPDVIYRGDVGATHGSAEGDRTRLRTYWSNQETGLVDDAVFELQVVPKNWGQMVFK